MDGGSGWKRQISLTIEQTRQQILLGTSKSASTHEDFRDIHV